MVFYTWKGYRDCIDVDYFDFPVEHIHGVPLEEPEWRRIDHCSLNRVKRIVTPALAVSNNATACTEWVQERFWAGDGAHRRLGLNVVPVVNPPNVFPVVEPNLPWDDGMLAGSLREEVTCPVAVLPRPPSSELSARKVFLALQSHHACI